MAEENQKKVRSLISEFEGKLEPTNALENVLFKLSKAGDKIRKYNKYDKQFGQVSTSMDVTKRHEIQQKFRTLFGQLNEMLPESSTTLLHQEPQPQLENNFKYIPFAERKLELSTPSSTELNLFEDQEEQKEIPPTKNKIIWPPKTTNDQKDTKEKIVWPPKSTTSNTDTENRIPKPIMRRQSKEILEENDYGSKSNPIKATTYESKPILPPTQLDEKKPVEEKVSVNSLKNFFEELTRKNNLGVNPTLTKSTPNLNKWSPIKTPREYQRSNSMGNILQDKQFETKKNNNDVSSGDEEKRSSNNEDVTPKINVKDRISKFTSKQEESNNKVKQQVEKYMNKKSQSEEKSKQQSNVTEDLKKPSVQEQITQSDESEEESKKQQLLNDKVKEQIQKYMNNYDSDESEEDDSVFKRDDRNHDDDSSNEEESCTDTDYETSDFSLQYDKVNNVDYSSNFQNETEEKDKAETFETINPGSEEENTDADDKTVNEEQKDKFEEINSDSDDAVNDNSNNKFEEIDSGSDEENTDVEDKTVDVNSNNVEQEDVEENTNVEHEDDENNGGEESDVEVEQNILVDENANYIEDPDSEENIQTEEQILEDKIDDSNLEDKMNEFISENRLDDLEDGIHETEELVDLENDEEVQENDEGERMSQGDNQVNSESGSEEDKVTVIENDERNENDFENEKSIDKQKQINSTSDESECDEFFDVGEQQSNGIIQDNNEI